MYSFFRIWFTGYFNLAKSIRLLADQPAPWYGLAAVLLRSAVVSLTWYLPAAIMGRIPDPAPYLPLIPSESYFVFLTWFFPLYNLGVWLLFGALAHLLMRLLGHPGGMDTILNIGGMSGLLVIIPLLAIDWSNLLLGLPISVVAWGLLHLLTDSWAIIFQATGFHQLLGLSRRQAFALVGIEYIGAIPMAMLVMRG